MLLPQLLDLICELEYFDGLAVYYLLRRLNDPVEEGLLAVARTLSVLRIAVAYLFMLLLTHKLLYYLLSYHVINEHSSPLWTTAVPGQ